MPRFKYRATDRYGSIQTGIWEANSDTELNQYLISRNLQLLFSQQLYFRFPACFHRSWTQDLIDLCLHVQSMDACGIPLVDILEDACCQSYHPKFLQTLNQIYLLVQEGESLSAALSRFPETFEGLFVQMVKMSENTGQFAGGFSRLRQYLEWEQATRSKFGQAIRYPIIVFCILLLALITLSQCLIPQLKQFSLATDSALSFSTQLLFSLCEMNFAFVSAIAATLMLGIFLMLALKHCSQEFCQRLGRAVLQIPIFGRCYLQLSLSRFFHCFASTCEAGIDLLSSLELSRSVLSNEYLQAHFTCLCEAIEDGQSLAMSFTDSSLLTKTTKRLLSIGEATGDLTPILFQIRDQYHSSANRTIQSILTNLEPSLILISGGVLLWLIVAILEPIYASFNHLEL